jgi:uncharacterized protein YukE
MTNVATEPTPGAEQKNLTDPIKILAREPNVRGSGVAEAVRDAGVEVQAVDWLWRQVVGTSLVETIIEPITGDFDEIERYGARWQNIADALTAVRDTMNSGLEGLRGNWHGLASDAFSVMITQKWEPALALDVKAAGMIKAALEKVAECSRLACKKVLDLIKKVIDLLIKAAIMLPIPVIGWARAMTFVKDAISFYDLAHDLVKSVEKVIETAEELIHTVCDKGLSLASITGARALGKAVIGEKGIYNPQSLKATEWMKKGISNKEE